MGTAELLDDHALMRAIADADGSALERLYDRHASALLGVCVRLLRDQGEAEEVLGQVFWEVWDRADRYDPLRASPMVYLVTLSRSRSLDRLRRRRREHRVQAAAEDLTRLEAAGGPAAMSANPLSDALAQEQRRRVRHALDGLTPTQRQVVELSFLDGLSHSEIADRLGEPLGTVKTWIRKGLLQLRDALRLSYREGDTA